MFERIVVPLDGSRLSARALPCATEIARKFGSEIILLRVVSEADVGRLSQSPGLADPVAAGIIGEKARVKDVESAAHAKRYLMNRANDLRDQGVAVSYNVLEGHPAREIMEFAAGAGASLIVMMSHGRGWFRRAILGSVTDAVIRGCSVPVLVIRASELGR